ncbi:hypothetical protein DPPLL_22430 [Desulfofustis limnaeus]|uniref:Uncharacterized protein n=1 Tax=Desulfofustis limnaeus TaxID=2740163 RepID=A0ABM7WAG8_9BACT|nr:hypothetical protein DPPLL_22430 [Desulfofustis limnaeus]
MRDSVQCANACRCRTVVDVVKCMMWEKWHFLLVPLLRTERVRESIQEIHSRLYLAIPLS